MPSLYFPKEKIKILLLEAVHKSALEKLKEDGYTNIEYRLEALNEDELIKIIGEYHFIGIRSRTQLTKKVFEKAKKLIGVGCFCVGTNQVDLESAKMAGIPVFHAPYSSTRSVAELVIAEVISLLRGLHEKNSAAHRGEWMKSAKGSYEVRGKTLGIIGYGHIGSQVGHMAESLGMHVFFYDAREKLPFGNTQPIKTLKELLKKSDVVSLHVPDLPETREMIGVSEIKMMKKGAHLINASRGKVVVIDALVEALKEKKLGGAAIDVFPKEPKSPDEEFISPLRDFENVILTPHVGGSTMEAQENIGREVAQKLINYSDIGSTLSSVNFSEVSLPPFEGKHRFLHIHKNKPGVLTAINKVFSKAKLNVTGQYLQTDPETGYVIIDIDQKGYKKSPVKELQQIPGTIRVRALY